jgi:voltage-gated potassium channel
MCLLLSWRQSKISINRTNYYSLLLKFSQLPFLQLSTYSDYGYAQNREIFHLPSLEESDLHYNPFKLLTFWLFCPFIFPLLAWTFDSSGLFRLFKVGRYSQSLTTLTNAIRSKKEELSITLFAGFIVLIIASTLMYLVEHKAQPDTFHSIPDAMWWGVVTLTTVGYGDVYPKTVLGKFLGAGIAVLGIGLFALPAGIIASGFTSEIQKEKTEIKVCPHCGKNLME